MGQGTMHGAHEMGLQRRMAWAISNIETSLAQRPSLLRWMTKTKRVAQGPVSLCWPTRQDWLALPSHPLLCSSARPSAGSYLLFTPRASGRCCAVAESSLSTARQPLRGRRDCAGRGQPSPARTRHAVAATEAITLPDELGFPTVAVGSPPTCSTKCGSEFLGSGTTRPRKQSRQN
jgi:hypothetical protein